MTDEIFEAGDEVVAVDAIRDGDVVYFTRKGRLVEIRSTALGDPPPGSPIFRARKGEDAGSLLFEPIQPPPERSGALPH
jgi:hypothetical protein